MGLRTETLLVAQWGKSETPGTPQSRPPTGGKLKIDLHSCPYVFSLRFLLLSMCRQAATSSSCPVSFSFFLSSVFASVQVQAGCNTKLVSCFRPHRVFLDRGQFPPRNDVAGLSMSFLTVQALRFWISGILPNQEGPEPSENGTSGSETGGSRI